MKYNKLQNEHNKNMLLFWGPSKYRNKQNDINRKA